MNMVKISVRKCYDTSRIYIIYINNFTTRGKHTTLNTLSKKHTKPYKNINPLKHHHPNYHPLIHHGHENDICMYG